MNLSKHLFWDLSAEPSDWDRYSRFVVERVLARGTMADWHEIRRYYGLERVKKEAMNARYLDRKTLGFCSAYFNIPREEFRCCTERLSRPQLWPC